MRKVVRAVFKGTDGSMGFRTKTIYVLDLFYPQSDFARFMFGGQVILLNTPVGMTCPYHSIESFKKNWKVLSLRKGGK